MLPSCLLSTITDLLKKEKKCHIDAPLFFFLVDKSGRNIDAPLASE